jgi:phenylpropionate dioxygenase-like ring-hydroxylating dioxygenase large terminal subunit
VTAGKAVGFTALGENLVAWRDRDGTPNVVHDRCPHRSIKLSVGRIFDGQLQCILHGLRFDGEGHCVMVPWEENDERRSHWPRSRLIRRASSAAISGPISAIRGTFRRRRSNGKFLKS